MPNKSLHRTAAPLCSCGVAGMIGRWIGCRCLFPAAVGELFRYANRVRKEETIGRMRMICMVLLTIFILQASVEAADKLRIGLVDFSAVYMPLPLGEKMGFFREQGLQAEFIRIRPTAALAALVAEKSITVPQSPWR